jgi:hypothetical protein
MNLDSRDFWRQYPVPAVVRGLFAVDLVLVALYALDRLVGQPSWFLSHFVDLNGEANLPTWASSCQLAGVAALLFLTLPRHERNSRSRRAIAALGLLLLFLSLDEVASIHEWLGVLSDRYLLGGARKGTSFARTGLWMVALVPAVILWVGWFVRPLLEGAFRPTAVRRLGLLGLVALLASAGGVEVVSNFVGWESVAGILMTMLEEGGEMVGATLMFWAALLVWQVAPAPSAPRPAPPGSPPLPP